MRICGNNDTIAAIATPPGQGGIGVVRISGKSARTVLARLWGGKPGAEAFESHRLYYGPVKAGGETIDRALAVWMGAPKSYTGEDVVEFSGHGGSAVMRRILGACCAAGARLAGPGEFTRRAFLNGKLDLVQAEAVADVIAASSEAGLKIAQEQLAGRLSQEIGRIGERLTDLRAFVEATIDFPEEDIEFIRGERVAERLAEIVADASRLATTFDEGRLMREGVRAAIAGLPNAGKSSLLNALAGRDRAIVHHEPGTTRDVVEESISIGGLAFHLRDTAGLRDADGEVERIGVTRTREEVDAADIVIYVVDALIGLTAEDERNLGALPRDKAIIVYNKVDLVDLSFRPSVASGGIPCSKSSKSKGSFDFAAGAASLRMTNVSAATGDGLDELKDFLVERVTNSRMTESGGAIVTNARHKDALDATIDALKGATDAAARAESAEFIAQHLSEAHDALGTITGATYTEAVLDAIFSRFCIGK